MTDDQLQQLLTAANPLTDERARGLEVADAQHELLAGVVAEPRLEPPARRGWRLGRRRAFGLAVAATAVVLVGLLSLRDGSGHQGSGTAWAAEQVRFAEASPLVLFDAPGWRVEYGDEETPQSGELHFRRGSTSTALNSAELTWTGGGMTTWLEDRSNDAALHTTAPVLGTTAQVYQYRGGKPGHRDITALFRYDGRVLEFRAGAVDVDAFKAMLARLKRVDADAWLSAMPASVVKIPDRDSTIRQMLRGVTVPPGFDPTDIKGGDLTKDRYQLGAAVSGTVACQWFKRWGDARLADDPAKEHQATAAMATAKHWPVLEEMAMQGAYPEVLNEYAAKMPTGNWYGRPLIGELDEGLGCDSLGVDLP
jgi:hypothetical protein